ncbi:hypothetical protein [Pontibacillus marinus]|uniref:Uncharacterized protein n=1 Tax=Pontibacillus marinus BH030004 = DSM 16465 TaxID=1385511 RepID=A0A0A5FWR0_9BACI|nr:hypothetical protein [Pontibacillus marinus]KGX83115.1 hypothetical protein N783_06460 [Pontibacillus marinus BH030004 = DSM 16465]
MFKNIWKIGFAVMLVICCLLGYFWYSEVQQKRTMKKDMILHYVHMQNDVTRHLEGALEDVDEGEKFKEHMIKLENKIRNIYGTIGNATFIGRHADIPYVYYNLYFSGSDIVYEVVDKLQNNKFSDQTLSDLKDYYKKQTDLTSQLNIDEFANYSLEEYMEKMEEVNDYMDKYEEWRPTYNSK